MYRPATSAENQRENGGPVRDCGQCESMYAHGCDVEERVYAVWKDREHWKGSKLQSTSISSMAAASCSMQTRLLATSSVPRSRD